MPASLLRPRRGESTPARRLHEPDALVVLCSAHHRGQYREQIVIEGRVSTGITFQHADGTQSGVVADPRAVDAHLQAFRALRSLGFREGETRRALEQVRGDRRRSSEASMERIARGAFSAVGGASTSAVRPVEAIEVRAVSLDLSPRVGSTAGAAVEALCLPRDLLYP